MFGMVHLARTSNIRKGRICMSKGIRRVVVEPLTEIPPDAPKVIVSVAAVPPPFNVDVGVEGADI